MAMIISFLNLHQGAVQDFLEGRRIFKKISQCSQNKMKALFMQRFLCRRHINEKRNWLKNSVFEHFLESLHLLCFLQVLHFLQFCDFWVFFSTRSLLQIWHIFAPKAPVEKFMVLWSKMDVKSPSPLNPPLSTATT